MSRLRFGYVTGPVLGALWLFVLATTLAVLMALLVLGGAVIRDFTIVLILGVVVGTYSSIFVASPALIEIQKRFGMGKSSEQKKKDRPQPATV